MTTCEVRLAGCRPEPMASYLKALGVLRLVGEQADREAVARWDAHGFVLRSALDEEAIEAFFLQQYRPTPVVSPWNNSSGFGPEGVGELQVLEASTGERLVAYRQAIGVARRVLARFSTDDLAKLGKPTGETIKIAIVRACRSELPDECVPWMDAAIVFTPNSRKPLAFPPLLGTGGNVGRLELSRNFHQRLLQVLAMTPTASQQAKAARNTAAWLRDALWDLGQAIGVKGSPGQFDPGATGGTNSAPSGKAPSILNPWDFVLMIEGSMLSAAGSARRLGVGTSGRSAAPFCADVASVGYAGAAPDEPTKGEVWLPLWERFVSLAEIRRLMAEGRVDWRGRHARTGLDFAKAASGLGVDRGITAFGRYVLADRFGQATVAVPAGRVRVRSEEAGGGGRQVSALPLAELDGWLNRVRRGSNPSAGVRQALRRVDRASFEVTRGMRGALTKVLVEVAGLEMAIGRARVFREGAGVGPVSGPTARRWVPALLDDVTKEDAAELRLAMSFASGHDRAESGRAISASLRTIVRPVAFQANGAPAWTVTPLVEGFGLRPAVDVLAAAHVRRVVDLLAVSRRSRDGQRDEDPGHGLATRFAYGRRADLADIAALVNGVIDDARLGELLGACMLLDWRERVDRRPGGVGQEGSPGTAAMVVPPALTVLGPFYARQPLTASWTTVAADGERPAGPSSDRTLHPIVLRPDPEWVALLAADRSPPVLTAALRRLRIAGMDPVLGDHDQVLLGRGQASRLAAALLCPLTTWSGEQLLLRICPPDPEARSAVADLEIAGPNHEETEEVDDVQP